MPNTKTDDRSTAEMVSDSRSDASAPSEFDLQHIRDKDRRTIDSFLQKEGRLPTADEIKDITGMKFLGRNDDFYQEALAYAEEAGIREGWLQTEDADIPGVRDYFWDESRLHDEGTKEGDLYDFYRSMGEAQHEVGRAETARSERDMQTEMAAQRQQLVDEVRRRRQNQLRSGLSSAQIANEEIQTMLMGQQAQQETAQQHFTQRTQAAQQHAMNPYMAEQQAREHIQGGQQGASAMYAAHTGDSVAQSSNFGKLSAKQKTHYDTLMKGQEE